MPSNDPLRKMTCEVCSLANDSIVQHTVKGKADHGRTAKHLSALAAVSEDDTGPAPVPFADDEPYDDEDAPRESGVGATRKLRVVSALPASGKRKAVTAPQLEEIGEIVEWLQTDVIQTIGPVAPVAGDYWAEHTESNTRNWQILCRNHPQLAENTLKAADWMAYYALGKFATGMLVAVGVEARFIDADGRIAQAAGVTDAWERVMSTREEIAREVADNYRLGEQRLPDESGSPWVGALAFDQDAGAAAGG